MMARLFATLAVLTYAAAVPVMELNDTHVFNPGWLSHARLHEVWQLSTNSAIGLVALWQVWVRNDLRWQCCLTLLVTTGFFLAYALQDSYGGSMMHTDGSEKTIMGVNIGLVGFGIASSLSMLAWVLGPPARTSSRR
ncbi:MAG: hypothetical protein A3E01_14845 [Gammaproteobacteria bacterium RIFCSPHIGHO2_12_FULL_63_22]|nr:MAG: hypothetical protein A3E01_14845 [Gammaproteobacteria bacterium RIFCSPHIGHO2_12_FULL_63_22]